MNAHWLTPAPLWNGYESDSGRMKRPAILSFTSETFMEELMDVLKRNPIELSMRLAHSESSSPLKLYQPVHRRFHLLAASLVCAVPGLPDRKVQADRGERVSFVIRALDGGGTESERPGEFRMFPVSFEYEGQRRRLWTGFIQTANTDPPGTTYVLRCIYRERCGETVVSAASEAFEIAAPDEKGASEWPWIAALDLEA